MATQLYTLASMYTYQEEMLRRDDARAQGNGDLQDMFQDLKIRLEDTFDLTAEQRVSLLLRSLCRNT